MTRMKTIAGALGVAAIVGGGVATTANAHPNLTVNPTVSCVGGAYTPNGIDQSGDVRFDWKLTTKTGTSPDVVQADSDYLGQSANGRSQDAGTLPPQFFGTAKVDVTAEGKTYTTGVKILDCRTPPPPVTTPPPPQNITTPPPTCAELIAHRPRYGKRRLIDLGCMKQTPPPPRRKREVCEAPTTLRIIQQQSGTFYTQTYPLRVTIRNTTGAVTPKGALIITDSGLQNFVAPNGSRTERLVVPVGAMRRGQTRVIDRTMGFVGVEAFQAYFTTRAQFMVAGRRCGFTSDRAFEG